MSKSTTRAVPAQASWLDEPLASPVALPVTPGQTEAVMAEPIPMQELTMAPVESDTEWSWAALEAYVGYGR